MLNGPQGFEALKCRSLVFDDFLKKPSKPFATRSLIRQIIVTKIIAKNTHNLGSFFSDTTTFEAFQLAIYLYSHDTLPWLGSLFSGSTGIGTAP